jgi:bifunctional non-homologous end joining protein LigD
MVRREGTGAMLYPGWVDRFPAILQAASRIKAQSFLIDGEAVMCRDDGLTDFEALRSRRRDRDVVLFAFDLIKHRGGDLRNAPLLDRKRQLGKLLGKAKHAIRLNEHLAMMTRPCSSMLVAWDLRPLP